MPFYYIARTAAILALLASMLVACATRAPHSPAAAVSSATSLEEHEVLELIAIWRNDLSAYLKPGDGDRSTRPSRLRDLQSGHSLRPGRIGFSTLAAGGYVSGAEGWDVSGLLLGRQTLAGRHWYLFVVGIVQRGRYRPVEIRDIRLVAFAAGGRDPQWRQGEAETQSLERYKETYRHNIPVRFPADDDAYQVEVVGDSFGVRELRSGAEWTLSPTAGR